MKSSVRRAIALIEMVRPLNSLMMAAAVLVGALIVAPSHRDLSDNALRLLIGSIVGFSLTASSMVFNDIMDVEIDRINAPHRPIPSGRASVEEAWVLFSVLSVVGVALSALTGPYTLALASSSLASSCLYSRWGKRLGLLGNAMVSYNVAIPIPYGSLLIERIEPKILVFSLMIFLANMGREVTKGIADEEGDKARGVRTLCVTRGPAVAAAVSVAFYSAAVALSPFPLLMGWTGPLYGALVALVDFGFAYSSIELLRAPSRSSALKIKRRALLLMLLGLLAFALSRIR
ncbi:MAG: geranylgeranylglycerol-phosphate geranylgeranyltransferase [Fervidicoccaceae archaeon]